jgi:hypothetical protein
VRERQSHNQTRRDKRDNSGEEQEEKEEPGDQERQKRRQMEKTHWEMRGRGREDWRRREEGRGILGEGRTEERRRASEDNIPSGDQQNAAEGGTRGGWKQAKRCRDRDLDRLCNCRQNLSFAVLAAAESETGPASELAREDNKDNRGTEKGAEYGEYRRDTGPWEQERVLGRVDEGGRASAGESEREHEHEGEMDRDEASEDRDGEEAGDDQPLENRREQPRRGQEHRRQEDKDRRRQPGRLALERQSGNQWQMNQSSQRQPDH